jgi:hypothetical protein
MHVCVTAGVYMDCLLRLGRHSSWRKQPFQINLIVVEVRVGC